MFPWSLCLYAVAASATPQIAYTERCVAINGNLTIQGHNATRKPAVCEWLGIPYAEPPVGQLRFAPPKQPTFKGGVLANKYGYNCPQNQAAYFPYPNATAQYKRIFSNFVNQANHTQSEDCLTLNIWSSPSHQPKPVMVWIHGGRFSAGTSNTPYYDGQFLASAQDVVVVTFNFRMNIFGFPGAPEGTQNLGFLDQYAAVSWVHENIAAFGGDPSRITIIGQSSGAQSVGNWAYAFKEKPLVAGAMSHSGSVSSFPANDMVLAAKNWYNVSGAVGCGTTGDTLACMRSAQITFSAILAAVKRVPPPPNNSATRSIPPFQITVDNKTAFTLSKYSSRLASGDLARMPYFQIDNDHESGFYRISALQQGRSPPESEWKSFEQTTFTYPMASEAAGRAKLGIPSYLAHYMADWDNLRLYDPPTSGAYHGVDVNMVIGNSEGVSGIAPSDQETRLTEIMQRAWASFARDPVSGLDVEGWPRYNPSNICTILIGTNSTASIEFRSSAKEAELCSTLGLRF